MTSRFARGSAGAALAFALLAAAPAPAQDETSNRVTGEEDWSVFEAANPKECFAVSAPKQSVNTQDGRVVTVRRGETRLFVTYRPNAGVTGEVSFTGGYPFADGSSVTLDVGGTQFELFTEGEYAWPATDADDARIADAMKRGAEAVLTGRSGRGTQTEDTFSLFGFTAAMEDAASRCTS